MIRSAGWPIWLVAAIWMMYNAASISYLSFAGDYFVSQGYSVSYAGFLTSINGWCSVNKCFCRILNR